MLRLLALEARDAFLEQVTVEVEADGGDVAALFRTEDVARAANLQVAHRDFEPAAEGRVLLDRADPFARALDEVYMARQKNVSVRLVFVAADAAAKLIQVAQPKTVGAVNNDGIGVRDIEAALNDGRTNQHVNLPFNKAMHDFLEFMLVHLAMADIDADFRFQQQVRQAFGDHIDALDAIVEEVNLAAAIEFALDGLFDEPFIVRRDDGFHRQAVLRRRLDGAHIARAGQREVERARNRRGAERQDVDQLAHLLEAFLVQHTEPLLLINDDEPEIFEEHVATQQAVRADNDVHTAFAQELGDLCLFALRTETREHFDGDRVPRHAFAERVPMLFSENRRRAEDRDLKAA